MLNEREEQERRERERREKREWDKGQERQREERIECWSPTEWGVNRMLVANRTGCESNVGRQPKRLFFPPIPEKEKTEEEGTAVASFSIRSCLLLIWDCFLVRLLLDEELRILKD